MSGAKTASKLGPEIDQGFEDDRNIFPGRLHIYEIETQRSYLIETKQGDSEILLIENNTVYYRVSDRLYSATITEMGIGTAKLLVEAPEIRDVHWAFLKP